MARWKNLGEVYRRKSNFFTLREERVQLDDGPAGVYTLLDAPDFAACLPVTPDGQIVLIRNLRYCISEPLIEIPSGLMEEGEAPERAALREMEEEVGYSSKNVEFLSWFYATANLNAQKGHVFVAWDVFAVGARPEPTEALEVFLVDWKDALAMNQRGDIKHPASAYALMLAEGALRERKWSADRA